MYQMVMLNNQIDISGFIKSISSHSFELKFESQCMPLIFSFRMFIPFDETLVHLVMWQQMTSFTRI